MRFARASCPCAPGMSLSTRSASRRSALGLVVTAERREGLAEDALRHADAPVVRREGALADRSASRRSGSAARGVLPRQVHARQVDLVERDERDGRAPRGPRDLAAPRAGPTAASSYFPCSSSGRERMIELRGDVRMLVSERSAVHREGLARTATRRRDSPRGLRRSGQVVQRRRDVRMVLAPRLPEDREAPGERAPRRPRGRPSSPQEQGQLVHAHGGFVVLLAETFSADRQRFAEERLGPLVVALILVDARPSSTRVTATSRCSGPRTLRRIASASSRSGSAAASVALLPQEDAEVVEALAPDPRSPARGRGGAIATAPPPGAAAPCRDIAQALVDAAHDRQHLGLQLRLAGQLLPMRSAPASSRPRTVSSFASGVERRGRRRSAVPSGARSPSRPSAPRAGPGRARAPAATV